MNQAFYRENAKKFYQNAYRVQRTKPSTPTKQSTDVALPPNPTLQKTQSAPVKFSKNLTLSQVQRHQQGDHTFRNVLIFVLLAGIFIFAVDLWKEMQQERVELQVKRMKCYKEYQDNECENAVDAIKAKCHQLEMCFKHDINLTLRTTQSAAKLLGKLTSIFLKETGWLGAALVVAVLIISLTFIYKSSRSALTHQMTYKRE